MPQELMIQFKDFVEEKRAASFDASMSKCWINPVVTSSTLSHITSQHKSNHTGGKHNYEVVKRMKTKDDKSVTDSHTKSVEDETYNEKVVRSELLSSIERMTPAAKIIGMEDFFMASHKKVWTCPCIGVDQG